MKRKVFFTVLQNSENAIQRFNPPKYKQSHTPSGVQGGIRGDGTPPLDFCCFFNISFD